MAHGNVEHWLGSLLKASLHSVHMVVKSAHTAVSDPNMQLIEFLNTFPAQVRISTHFFVHTLGSEYFKVMLHTPNRWVS